MQLIGMLDSPYVRRTAVSLQLMGIAFDHRSLSVFGDFDAFAAVHPLVKAPTLICDDGSMLTDSTLIIDYAESLAGRSLLPAEPVARRSALRQVGLGLVMAEKAVQIVYERKRVAALRDDAWLARVSGQLRSACSLAEREVHGARGWLGGDVPGQADVTLAVAWRFAQRMVADAFDAAACPALAAFADRAEDTEAFKAWPFGG